MRIKRDDEATILALKPIPLQTMVKQGDIAGVPWTSVIRRWARGMAERCQLCRECTAEAGQDGRSMCIKAVVGAVNLDEDSAAFFSPDSR